MSEARELRLIATAHCAPYQCEAKIYIQDKHPSGSRHLIAQYGEGYAGRTDLPVAENGCREFAAGIPNDMTEEEIVDTWLLWPMKKDAQYPTWEIPARVHGSPYLFRWWRGEKAE